MTDDVEQLALQRSRSMELSDNEFRWALQQIEGKQKMRQKTPELCTDEHWWWPVRISLEQSSSQATAQYKAQLLQNIVPVHCPTHLIDLTGGIGVDCLYMGKIMGLVDYIELNEELCRIATHNLHPYPIYNVHCANAKDWIDRYSKQNDEWLAIYIDPARRDKNGGKVFRLEDCTPNVCELLPTIKRQADCVMLKLSPMIDISAAVSSLDELAWDVHVVAIRNEVKEILLLSTNRSPRIHALDLDYHVHFTFSREEEHSAEVQFATEIKHYLYEPNAAIMKAGAYKLLSSRYRLSKLDQNSQLYTSDERISDFPGKRLRVLQRGCKPQELKGVQANVVARNYPMKADELRRKLGTRDGGNTYIIGTRARGNATLLLAEAD